MTIVEGQIGTLKQLKESLNRNGITRFNSTGEIKHFLRDYESEREQLLSSVESELEAEIQNMQSALISHQHSYEEGYDQRDRPSIYFCTHLITSTYSTGSSAPGFRKLQIVLRLSAVPARST